jgi:alpha-beta hydrolase superfamily lysophospholipase
VIYLHGLESHMGWFLNLAEFLNSKGINVYAFDRRGSGLNKNSSRNFSSRYISSDLKIFIDLVKKDHPESRIFLIGLCLGGKIAVDFFSYYKDYLNGLILVSPSLKNKLKFSLADKLSILFKPNSLLKVPIKDSMFTSNERYLRYIGNDSLRLRYIPAQHLLEIAKMEQHLKKASGNIKLPVLLMLAGIDDIIDTAGAKRWYEHLPSRDKTLKFYKDYHHLLTFEENAGEVMGDIAEWIKGRANA